ncbi:hypothetical protein IKE86_00370 [Candidatus Saccharibacteria bacterium]|nr:hypothetical protein [Candidatus Saccharibacteria bacterium]
MEENNISRTEVPVGAVSGTPTSEMGQLVDLPIPEEPRKKTGKLVGLAMLIVLLIGGGVFAGIKLLKKDENSEKPTAVEPMDVDGEFAMRFLRLENNQKNMIYSPLSIKYGLSLLKDGADGTTKSEIEDVLGEEEVTKYQNIEEKLSLANAVFIRDSFSPYVAESYKEVVTSRYNSELILDKFQSAAIMDNWVSEKTFGLIKEVGMDIDEKTEMVLANALAIQMEWATKFNGTTLGRNFYKADGSEVEATTLAFDETKSENVAYYKDENVTMATIDLEALEDGTQLEFIAVMPEGALLDYAKTASVRSVMEMEAKKTKASATKDGVDLYIPKFKFEHKLDFMNDLKKLGIQDAFSIENANFAAMVDLVKMKQDFGNDYNIYVSQAIHKANIDFSEKGIKAAAVTAFAMRMEATAMMDEPEPVVVRIDRPFLFMIVDKETKEVWFVGTMYEPNLWEEEEVVDPFEWMGF